MSASELEKALEKAQEIEKARVYLFFKWVAMAVVFCVITAEALLGNLNQTSLIADYLGLALTGGVSLALEWLTRTKRVHSFMTLFSLLCDQVFVFMALYLTGGPENTWWFLPVCGIFVAGYVFSRMTALLVALFSTIAISLDFTLEYSSLIPHYHANPLLGEYFRNSYYLYDYLLGMTLLYLLGALISSHFSQLMKQNSTRLEKSLAEAQAAQLTAEESHRALLNLMEDLDRAKLELERKVNQRTAELETANVSLESKVAGRTADLENSRKAILHMMKNLKDDLAKMQVVDKLKTEFLSMVSHELRTPLTPIKGYLALILTGKMGEIPPQQRHALELVAHQAEHLHSLIDNVLDVARLDIGKPIPMLKQLISVETLVEETSSAMELQAGEKQLKLTVVTEGHIPTLMADEIKLKRVLANLIGNALKFTPEGGEITVRTSVTEGPAVRIEVSDNGIGLTRENLEKVFEKFYQVDSSATRSVGGIGMGLPISRELVRLHGGKLWVESDGPGRGSRFIFTLPVV